MTWDHGKVEAVTVDDPGRDGDLDDVMEEERAGPLTTRAALSPRLSATATLMARQPDGDFDWRRHTSARLVGRHTYGRVPPRGRLVDQEPSTDAIDGERHRREVDDDFIGKATHIDATIIGRHEGHWFTTEGTEGVSTHQSAGTIGISRGEVNGRQRVPDVQRNDASS